MWIWKSKLVETQIRDSSQCFLTLVNSKWRQIKAKKVLLSIQFTVIKMSHSAVFHDFKLFYLFAFEFIKDQKQYLFYKCCGIISSVTYGSPDCLDYNT